MNRKWLNNIWCNKYIQSSTIFTTISLAVSFLNYIFNFIIARKFPLTIYGDYMSALAYLAILTVPLGILNILLVKKIGAVDSKERFTLTNSLEKHLVKNIIEKKWYIIITFIVIVGLLIYRSHLGLISIFWILAMWVLSLGSVFYSSALQAYKYFGRLGVINVFTAVVKIVLIFLFVKFTLNKSSLFSVILLSVLISVLLLRKIAIRPFVKNSFLKIEKQLNVINLRSKNFWLPLLSTLGLVGLVSIDLIIVKGIYSADDVGLYAGLTLFGKIILFVTAPLTTVAFAYFTGKDSKKLGLKILGFNSFLILMLGLIILVIYRLRPEAIIYMILGVKFISLAPLIFKAAVFGLLYSLVNLYSQYAVAKNHLICLMPLLLMLVQAAALLTFHGNFDQILKINILIVFLANIFYFVWLIKISFLNKIISDRAFA